MSNYSPSKKPSQCKNITDVRDEIDGLDQEILRLLGIRFQYVKEVVNYKEKTKDSIVAVERREKVIAQRREWAEKNGLSADVIEDMYRNLIRYFIAEEMKTINLEQ